MNRIADHMHWHAFLSGSWESDPGAGSKRPLVVSDQQGDCFYLQDQVRLPSGLCFNERVYADTASLGENLVLLAASVAPHFWFGSRLMVSPAVGRSWQLLSGWLAGY